MLLRTALLSLAAFAVCQISYGQSWTPQGPAASVPPRAIQPVANRAAPVGPGPIATTNGPPMDYGMSTLPAEGVAMDEAACGDGSCGSGATNYVPWWHQRFVWSYWKIHGLPSPWCPPGNLTLHIQDCPCASTYYYFRPYNWFHISEQQSEAANYNGDPRNPYDNRVVFDGLYDGL